MIYELLFYLNKGSIYMKKLIVLSSVFFVALSGILSPGLYAQDTLEEILVSAPKRKVKQ